MKKNVNLRSILVALSIVLTMGLGTAVFAEPDEGQAEATTTNQVENEIAGNQSLPDTEELLRGFMLSQAEQELGEEPQKKRTRGSKLTGQRAIVYGILSKKIKEIANGDRAETQIIIPVSNIIEKLTYSAEELGVDALVEYDAEQGKLVVAAEAGNALAAKVEVGESGNELILNALLADFPYDLYWYDKSDDGGCKVEKKVYMTADEESITITEQSYVSFEFWASQDYAQEIDEYTYNPLVVDQDRTAQPKNAAENAAAIVNAAAEKSDIEKLKTYRTEICGRVEYNDAAAEDEDTPYGDPWQMIYVFDDNEETNVVCEGYSKAFKFLCDITGQNDGFDNNKLDCYLVTGPMSYEDKGETVMGPHMWNIVTLEDGENYLVDVTNCDSVAPGIICTSDYLLKGDPNGSSTGYTVKDLTYEYDEETKNLYDEGELTISKTDYDLGGEPEPEPETQSIADATITGISNRTYTGKAQTQTPTVKLGTVTLTNGEDYEITYKNNINVGKATITITGINGYEGKIDKTFSINPRGTSIRSMKKGKKNFTVKWTKQAAQTSGYQVQYGLKSSFKGAKTVTVSGAGKVSKKVTKLKKKKNYYVRVRTFTTVSGTKYYSAWSKAKKVKTK